MDWISTSTSLERYRTNSFSFFLSFYLTHTASYYVIIRRTLLSSSASYYTVLHCPTLHYIALHCTALHCTTMFYPLLFYPLLYCPSLDCLVLCCPALHCSSLFYPTPHYTAQQIVTKGNDILVKVQTPDNMRTLDPTNPLRRNPQRDRDSDRERGRNSEVLMSVIDVMGFISSCVPLQQK